MQLLCDFFDATKDELVALKPGSTPPYSLPIVLGKLASLDKLAELHDIVLGSWTAERAHIYDEGRVPLPGELLTDDGPASIPEDLVTPLTVRLCCDMVDALADADEEQVEEFVDRWAAARDWAEADLTREHIAAMLAGIASLAKHARDTGRDVYVWLGRWLPEFAGQRNGLPEAGNTRLLSDFFIATPGELRSLDLARSPVVSLPTVLARGVDGGDLLVLESLIDGSLARDPRTNEGALQAWEAWDSYPGALEVQGRVVRALARAGSQLLEMWGLAWYLNTRCKVDEPTERRMATLVVEMGQLARQAVATGRDMYVWLWNGPAREV